MACHCDGLGHARGRDAYPFANRSLQGARGRDAFPFANRSLQGAPRLAYPFSNTNLQGHPHTVATSHVPLYLRGGLGDDPVYGPPVTIDTVAQNIDTGYGPGIDPNAFDLSFPTYSPDTPVNPDSGVVFGPPGPGQPGGVPVASSVTSSLVSAFTNLFKPSGPAPGNYGFGPSPRVSATPAGTISMASALPMIGIGIVGIVLLSSVGGRRRR